MTRTDSAAPPGGDPSGSGHSGSDASSSDASGSDAFAADLLRGHTDTIVLGVLRAGDSYGFEIYKTIRDATGGEHAVKEATLYATYRRLVKDGLIEAYWGDETQGGRRKYYRITDAGRAVFSGNVAAWITTRRILDTLLHTKDLTEGQQR